jgi:hypothetical protein
MTPARAKKFSEEQKQRAHPDEFATAFDPARAHNRRPTQDDAPIEWQDVEIVFGDE